MNTNKNNCLEVDKYGCSIYCQRKSRNPKKCQIEVENELKKELSQVLNPKIHINSFDFDTIDAVGNLIRQIINNLKLKNNKQWYKFNICFQPIKGKSIVGNFQDYLLDNMFIKRYNKNRSKE